MDAKAPMPSTDERMKSVRQALDKAAAGPKKDTALWHYQAAEKARSSKNDAECSREVNAAAQALA